MYQNFVPLLFYFLDFVLALKEACVSVVVFFFVVVNA